MVLGAQWVVRKLLCEQLGCWGFVLAFSAQRPWVPWLEPLLVLGLPLPAGLGTASLHGACRAVWALLPAGLRGCLWALCALWLQQWPRGRPWCHLRWPVAGGKSVPLLVMGVADAVWQESRLVCSWNAGQASPNPSLSHRKVALIYLFCIWLFFQHWSICKCHCAVSLFLSVCH